MLHNNAKLITEVRDRFAHIDECPFEGKRIFFENAGGALTLKSVVEHLQNLLQYLITKGVITRQVMH